MAASKATRNENNLSWREIIDVNVKRQQRKQRNEAAYHGSSRKKISGGVMKASSGISVNGVMKKENSEKRK